MEKLVHIMYTTGSCKESCFFVSAHLDLSAPHRSIWKKKKNLFSNTPNLLSDAIWQHLIFRKWFFVVVQWTFGSNIVMYALNGWAEQKKVISHELLFLFLFMFCIPVLTEGINDVARFRWYFEGNCRVTDNMLILLWGKWSNFCRENAIAINIYQ